MTKTLKAIILWVSVFSFCNVVFGEELEQPNGVPSSKLTLKLSVDIDGEPFGVSFNKEFSSIAVGKKDSGGRTNITLMSTIDGSIIRSMEIPNGNAPASFTPNGEYLFAGATKTPGATGLPYFGSTSTIWNVQDGSIIKEVNFLMNTYTFSPDGAVLYAGKGSNTGLYSFPDLTLLEEISSLSGQLRFSSDGSLFVGRTSSTNPNKIGVWKTSDKQRLIEVKSKSGFGGVVQSYALGSDNKILATAHKKGIDIWRVEDGSLVKTIGKKFKGKKKRDFPIALEFNETGTHLFAGYLGFFSNPKDSAIRIWRISDGELIASYYEKGTKNELPWFLGYNSKLGVFIQKNDEKTISYWRHEEMTALFEKAE